MKTRFVIANSLVVAAIIFMGATVAIVKVKPAGATVAGATVAHKHFA